MIRIMRLAAFGLMLPLAACGGDGPVAPAAGSLTVVAAGRLERGAVVDVVARQGSAPARNATFRAEPAAAVAWLEPGRARLLETGIVTFHATSGAATGSAVVTVVAPPSVVFESTGSGSRDIWRIALDGAELLRLTNDAGEDMGPTAAGGTIHFLSHRVSPAAVFSVPAGGGTAVRVTTAAGEFSEPAISPDGQRLAFLRTVGGVSKLHVSARNGAGAQRVTTSGGGVIEVSPAWSPDGLSLAFVSTAAGNADVYVVPASGGTPRAVGATAAPELEPAWSPDGSRIVFARADGARVDLWTVVVATGEATRLTAAGGVAAWPAWLPDGRIVFAISEGAARLLHWLDPADPATLHRIPHTVPVAGRPAAVQ